jgi:type I restriction-modification system DNA methylase subunit
MPELAKLQKDFISGLTDLARLEGFRPSEAMERFLELSFIALRGKTLQPQGAEWTANEEAWTKQISRLHNPEASRAAFSELLAITMAALNERRADFLGPVWMEVGASSQLGQFFTPHELSALIARITVDPIHARKMVETQGYFTAHEPAAGMGGMVLAAAEVFEEAGLDLGTDCLWDMIELDYSVFKGCYIQMALSDIPAIVRHGNTLTLDIHSSHSTPACRRFVAKHGFVGPFARPAPEQQDDTPGLAAE